MRAFAKEIQPLQPGLKTGKGCRPLLAQPLLAHGAIRRKWSGGHRGKGTHTEGCRGNRSPGVVPNWEAMVLIVSPAFTTYVWHTAMEGQERNMA